MENDHGMVVGVNAPYRDMNDITEMLVGVVGFGVRLDVLNQGGLVVSLGLDPICQTSSANVGATGPFMDFAYHLFCLM